MNPILIDVTRLIFRTLKGKRPTGVDRVGLAYVSYFHSSAYPALAVLAWKGKVVVLSERKSEEVFLSLLEQEELGGKVSRSYWFRVLANLSLSRVNERSYRGCFLFNTGHKGLESEAYAQALKKMGVRPIYFVHDLIPITHPEYCRPDEKEKHTQRMLRILNDADAIIVNSAYTEVEIKRFAIENALSCPITSVAWLASKFVADESNGQHIKLDHSGFQKPYFVALSTIEPRKNHLLLLHIWRQMVNQYPLEQVPQLILIGQRGWECEQVLDLLERCDRLRDVVLEQNHCSDEELVKILSGARALLFPSFVEGFGMPLVESLASGIPVIASDIPVFREIGQDIPDFIDENDGPNWRDMVLNYASEGSKQRAAQMKRMEQYKPWTWHDHFRKVEELLERLNDDGR